VKCEVKVPPLVKAFLVKLYLEGDGDAIEKGESLSNREGTAIDLRIS
jgi:hypothetical protein